MIDFYLKLANEAAMSTVLSDFYNEDGEFVPNTSDYAIDVVGVLSEPTGSILTTSEGLEYYNMQAIPGWHVNIRLLNDTVRKTVESLNTLHGVSPESPKRIWL
jgi:hypothetical protein